ncbi:MAG: hypothetical protein VW239_00230 [Candidatus Nanopelagicales bacterium]
MTHLDARADAHPEDQPEQGPNSASIRTKRDRISKATLARIHAWIDDWAKGTKQDGAAFRGVFVHGTVVMEPMRVSVPDGKRINVRGKQ